jgi:S1-C subfamily serine protease
VKEYLSRQSVPFQEVDVSRDPAAAEEMVRISGQSGVPVTVINEQAVVGFDQQRLGQLVAAARRPRLGAAVADAAAMAAKGRCTVTRGAYVGRVRPGSVADEAGLQPGDVIVTLADQSVSSVLSLETLLARIRPGQTVPLVYIRGDQERDTRIRF